MRGIAICSVVWNHATKGPDGVFGGGMTFLLMLSGYNFARFSLRGATPATARGALWHLGVRVGVPSLLLLLLIFAGLGKFDLKEALFVSNWWTKERIAIFPVWYPQVMLQMFLLLYLFFLTPFARIALARPLWFALATFLIGILIRVTFPAFVWNTGYLNDNLPHLFLWNFALGWVVFFLVANGPARWPALLAAIGCVVLGAFAGWGWHRLDFWWLIVGGSLFVMIRTLLLPKRLAFALGIVSQAAFAIFLLHRPFFSVLEHFHPAWKQGATIPHFLFGLAGSIAVWLFLTAVARAYRQFAYAGAPATVRAS